ncbi:MAG: phosphohydrolase [Flavobacteriaceae bacterium]|nr:phosphohydrolase [Flavobacteriaceae bacterium]
MKHKSIAYKIFLIFLSSFIIVYLFPREGKFKYEFQKGKVWQYATYFAPFDFSILKSDKELNDDKQNILESFNPYYRIDNTIKTKIFEDYNTKINEYFSNLKNEKLYDSLFLYGKSILEDIYNYGVISSNELKPDINQIFLIDDNIEIPISIEQLFDPSSLFDYLTKKIELNPYIKYKESYNDLFFDLIVPNVFYDEKFNLQAQKSLLDQISLSRGVIRKGELIIAQGEVVDDEQINILNSLRMEFLQREIDSSSSNSIVFGYSILMFLIFFLLIMFLNKYRLDIYNDNRKLTFIFFNILLMVVLSTMILEYNPKFIYAAPICITPLVIKVFFDTRLALFIHLIIVLSIGFIVPNSFEFIFLQMIAGIIATQSITQFYRRANIFIAVSQILLVYFLAYFSFSVIQEGNFKGLELIVVGLFILNGLFILFVLPLIYIYEKVFGLVSDVSLLELTDTNSPLLKELSDKAPGTFYHSLQVANLAEAAANEINANTLLIRVGALYHDIGKLKHPNYYTENLSGNKSVHEDLSPINSTKLIIDHVEDGVIIAKKNNLPERVIDFIKTHHGTSLVYYFYKKNEELKNDNYLKEDFQYPGPKPFSKETAILMMADSVEAASKSLKTPSAEQLEDFVNKIVSDKMNENQFDSSNITLKEIEIVKNVLFKKLVNIYQLRIEYPE